MIKKFKLYILMAAVALSATSCLDKMPEDSIPFDDAIQTVDDVNLAVIGIYDAFKNSALYSGNLTILPDLQTDLVYGINGNTNTYGDIWRWKDILATNTSIEAVYAGLYDVPQERQRSRRPHQSAFSDGEGPHQYPLCH